jgi:spore germination cell wall hydrolase CwlJ-like protein
MRNYYDMIIKVILLCILTLLIVLGHRVTTLVIEQQEQNRILEEYKNSERDCLVTALYHEARGEGIKGLEAVASVIYNRKNHPYYPSTYCGIVNQYKQFSYTLLDKNLGEVPAYESKVYAKILDLSDSMVDNRFKPTLPPSVMWYTTTKVSNKWTKKKKIVADIGKHRFYADKEGKI